MPGETVTIAARAVVEGEGPDGTHPQCLLGDKCVAWGEGPRFRPRLPAMYFTYEVQEALLCGDETSKCVFVTNTLHDGDLGSLAGGDEICQDLAEGSLAAPGTYKAWLSIGQTGNSAAERLTQGAVPYKLVDGTTVANDFADLTTCDGSGGACLLHPIDLTETGAGPVDAEVWTATGATGMREGGDCGGWTVVAEEDVLGSFGLSSAVDANWTLVSNGEAPCSEDRRLYCFQQ